MEGVCTRGKRSPGSAASLLRIASGKGCIPPAEEPSGDDLFGAVNWMRGDESALLNKTQRGLVMPGVGGFEKPMFDCALVA